MTVKPDCTNCRHIGSNKCKTKQNHKEICINWRGDPDIIKRQNELLEHRKTENRIS